MNPTQTISTLCQHQNEIVHILAWVGGISPIVSMVSWFTAKWGKLPPGTQAILQLASANVLHALLGEPTSNTQGALK